MKEPDSRRLQRRPGSLRSGGRVVEGARLESEYTSKAYRGFESLPLRQTLVFRGPQKSTNLDFFSLNSDI